MREGVVHVLFRGSLSASVKFFSIIVIISKSLTDSQDEVKTDHFGTLSCPEGY